MEYFWGLRWQLEPGKLFVQEEESGPHSLSIVNIQTSAPSFLQSITNKFVFFGF